MAVEQWKISDEARESVQPYVDQLERICPEMMALQMRRLVALAKAHLPPMETAQAAFLVKCLRGFRLPFAETVPTDEIGRMIGDHIAETFSVNFGAKLLPEELKKFRDDHDWQMKFSMMPENVFADHLEAVLNPLQAYLLIVMVECYWEHHNSMGSARVSDFFNIEDLL
jgi:hypothetical protein